MTEMNRSAGKIINQPGKLRLTILSLTLAFGALLYMGCGNEAGNSDKELTKGKRLAMLYCQSCHLEPDPSLLPKENWSAAVLPVMGLFLGTTPVNTQMNETERSLFPAQPLMSADEWQELVAYYIDHAPAKLPDQPATPAVTRELPMFDIRLPAENSFYSTAAIVSFCKIDTTVQPARLFVANAVTNELLLLNTQLQLKNKISTPGPVVDISFAGDRLLTCNIGADVSANDACDGSIRVLDTEKGNNKKVVFDSLCRPVQVLPAELNGDQDRDYIIAQFGNLQGQLGWMENKGTGYDYHLIKNMPGALHTIIRDKKHDGLPDLWTLFSQGDECIVRFTNMGGGKFEEKKILRFPPSYGSSFFDLVDIDLDGDEDIIYTCGDNGDYSRVLKPYHGVYIYINDGKDHFTQKSFYPINGCYKAICYDFDRDGDMDIATISYFPAAVKPWESFIYLQNNGALNFKPYTLPVNIPFQKGMTMDAGDLDGDGRMDLLLGNGYYSSDAAGHKEPLFIFLKGK